jgi:hypothetical protein
MFDLDPTQRLAVQLGRPLAGWWDTYFEEPHRTGGPDRLMRAEVTGFIDLVRERSRSRCGIGIRSDHIAMLLANAGMLARTVAELDHALDRIAAWYDVYSDRAMRASIATRLRERGIAPVPRPARGPFDEDDRGLWTRLRERIARRRADQTETLPGRRRILVGTTQLDLSIGLNGEMRTGVVIRGTVWIIMNIDDRDDRGPRPVPAPTPELIA